MRAAEGLRSRVIVQRAEGSRDVEWHLKKQAVLVVQTAVFVNLGQSS